MQVPRWKKWLSHIAPLTLETAGSEYNPELTVVLDRGRLQLLSGNAIYSWDDLYHNFTIAFGTLDFEQEEIEDVLVLGLGLGSVPYILVKIYKQNCRYVAVELDEMVAGLASKYALARLESPIELIVADAEIFVEISEEKFDLVAIDIFEDDRTPAQFESVEFLENCARRLHPGGLLLYNRLYNTPQNVRDTSRFFSETFLNVFPDGWKIDTGGNWVLAARHEIVGQD